MKFIYRVLVLLFCSNLVNHSLAQTDTSFWFVAPEATNNNNSGHGDRPVYFRFTALNKDAIITISQPANASFMPITINLAANTSQSFDITPAINLIENKPANQVLNFGLLIRSTAFITTYYEAASVNNPEIFVLKGRNALGTNFFIPTQTLLNNSLSTTPAALSGFDIVATEDATSITITPTQNMIGNNANTPFTIILNKGQTYSAIATSNLATNHLAGSTVTSDKPIAITIKDDSIGGGSFGSCSDLGGEQIVPLSLIGTKYISLPGYLNNPPSRPTDNIFVLATQDNTTITFNTVVVATINKGQTYMHNSFNNVFYIEASSPIYVLHLSGFGCEVGHALLPQLDCSGSRTVGFTRSLTSPLYANILVPTGGETGFSFNGDISIINAAQFLDVPFSGGLWKYARIEITNSDLNAGGTAIVKNNSKDFHLSIIHGDAASGGRYGYFSGFNKFEANTFSNATTTNPGCVGDSLKLFCDVGSTEGVVFSWSGPNGFISNLQNPTLPNMQINMIGTYSVIATKPGCATFNLSTLVSISFKPLVNVNVVAPICANETFNLSASSAGLGSNYSWIGPNGYTSNLQINIINNATSLASGTYVLITTKDGCKDFDTVNVVVKPIPDSKIATTNPICKLANVSLINGNTITPVTYNWSGPNGFTSNLQNVNFSNINFSDSGKYILTTIHNACISRDSIDVKVNESPNIIFDAIPNFCIGDMSKQILAYESNGLVGSYNFSGLGVSPTGLFNANNAGVGNHLLRYTFNALNGCNAFKEQPTLVFDLPKVHAGEDKTIIENRTTRLNGTAIGAIQSLKWTPNYNLTNDTILNPSAAPLFTTTYSLKATTINGCIVSDTVNVKVLPNIIIVNIFSPNGDGINDTWSIPALAAFSKCNVQIFDRNGKSIFKSIGYNNEWNGKFNNKSLPVGTYYYIINLNDSFLKEPLSGAITLIR